MTTTREQVMSALFTILQTAPGFNTYTRRGAMWADVAPSDMPWLGLLDVKPEKATRGKQLIPSIRELAPVILIYINTSDPNIVPSTVLNNLLDGIDPVSGGVLKSTNGNFKQTLGGIVTDCYIEGDIVKEPGDLDGHGLALIQLKIEFMQP